MGKIKIQTNNKHICQSFRTLKFTNDIMLDLKKCKNRQINKIINNINKNKSILETKKVGEYIVVSKKNPFNFEIYLK